ncbi:MAG: hypothetical protein ACFFEY_14885, partial [Candidatus Thorarchaeota archaeon]
MRLKIEFLINTSIDYIIRNLNFFFNKLVQQIRIYLNLSSMFTEFNIEISKEPVSSDKKEPVYRVKRSIKNNLLNISIPKQYVKFIKIILLKEAYKSFIPKEIQDNEIINIFINQKVEIDLQSSNIIEDWKDYRRSK